MTASSRAVPRTDNESAVSIDTTRPGIHVEFRVCDPNRQDRIRAAMDRLRGADRSADRRIDR
ncbi:MAG: hypothetical protein J2P18_22165 [Nocardia sp.]|nr:hypothetical protein [Nocardia sp.]